MLWQMATIFHHAASNITPMVNIILQFLLYVWGKICFIYITGGHSVGVTEFTINMPNIQWMNFRFKIAKQSVVIMFLVFCVSINTPSVKSFLLNLYIYHSCMSFILYIMYSLRGDKSLYLYYCSRLNCSAASSGSAQEIETIHGKGFRCVANPYSQWYHMTNFNLALSQ